MREHRGISIETKKWVYGWYVQVMDSEGETIHLIATEDASYRRYGATKKDWLIEDATPVIPETVGQYTGLKDKNGVEACHKDIVKDNDEIGTIEHGHYIVNDVYDCGETEIFGFYLHLKSYRNDGSHYWLDKPITYIDFFEIIGNIHENPDLLEQK